MKTVWVRIIVGVVCMLLIVALAFVFQYLWRIKIPKHQLLGQLHSGAQEIAFKPPKGDHYQLVVGLPQDEQHGRSRVYGTISLKNGTNEIAEIPFDTANCTTGNWLAGENLNAFIVTFSHNESLRNLDRQLAKKLPINVHIQADGTNVEGASLWLSYLERWMY